MSNPFPMASVTPATTQDSEASNPATADAQALQLAQTIAAIADDRKGEEIRILQVNEVSYLADFFVIVTGFSTVQVRSIARSIEAGVETGWHRRPLRTEGQTDGRWILQDFGEVIVHIFLADEREFYNLDAFWAHAQVIPFPPLEG